LITVYVSRLYKLKWTKATEQGTVSSSTCRWARLVARMFDIDMQHCPNCGAVERKK